MRHSPVEWRYLPACAWPQRPMGFANTRLERTPLLQSPMGAREFLILLKSLDAQAALNNHTEADQAVDGPGCSPGTVQCPCPGATQLRRQCLPCSTRGAAAWRAQTPRQCKRGLCRQFSSLLTGCYPVSMAPGNKVLRGFEPRSLDSESRVLAVTP